MEILVHILIAVGSVGLFLYGMKTMSSALQKLAGGSLRRSLSSMTLSPLKGVLSGTLVTAVVQSSSAVTVMIVSFVNAGLIGLPQSVAMMMGANIGTTATGWLVALSGFRFDLGLVAVPLIGLAFPLTLVRRNRVRAAAAAALGLALLLLALDILKNNMEAMTADPSTLGALARFGGYGDWAPLLFVGVGAVLTVVVQSSSAMMALTIVLCSGGLIPLECGMGMVLGENLGTTATANLAAVVTGRDARRSALSHFLFNLFGLCWAVPLLPWFAQAVPATYGGSQAVVLALFHTLFNAANTLLLVGFIPQIVRLTGRLVRPGRNERGPLPVAGSRLVQAGGLTRYQLRRELQERLRRNEKLFSLLRDYFRETNSGRAGDLFAQIAERSAGESRREDLAASTEKSGYGSFVRIEAAVDSLNAQHEALAGTIRRKREEGVWFPQPMRERIFGLFDYLGQLYALSVRMLDDDAAAPSGGESPCGGLGDRVEEYVRQSSALYGTDEATLRASVVFAELLVRFGQLSASATALLRDIAALKRNENG